MEHKKQMRIKKTKTRKKKLIVFLLLVLFVSTIYVTYQTLSKLSSLSNPDAFLRNLLQESNHTYQNKNKEKTLITNVFNFLSNINFKNPSTLLSQTSVFFEVNKDHDENVNIDDLGEMSEYVKDPYPNKKPDNPIIYIYNTHQLEQYSVSNIEPYNIRPNVMMTSYILREKLNEKNLPTIVEENNVGELLKANNWNYASSYKITKMLMKDAKEKDSSLTYFIDIHRDSVNKKISTATINDKRFAKILFIVGLENKNYQKNLHLTERINKELEKLYPGISRGIYKKEGSGVNGVYNQDFSPTTILIEMGGEENSIDEVLNTSEAVAESLEKIIKEDTKS